MANTKIEWAEKSWNPIIGCTKCSPGCDICYAERMAYRLACMGQKKYQHVATAHGWTGDVYCDEKSLDIPLKWKKPRRIFPCSMSDLFHPKVSFEFIDKVFAIMASSSQHIFLILTKRPQRMLEWFSRVAEQGPLHANMHQSALIDYYSRNGVDLTLPYQVPKKHTPELAFIYESTAGVNPEDKIEERKSIYINKKSLGQFVWRTWPLSNIHLGVSISNPDELWKVEVLLRIPAAVRWLSIEPMLGEIDIKKYLWLRQKCVGEKGCGYTGASYEFDNPNKKGAQRCPQCGKNHSYLVTDSIDWVVVGGESGPGARPMHLDWARSIRDQCVAAGVPFFFKQWGGVNKKKAGRLLDGREWNQYP